MYCRKCGARNSDQAKFCRSCGAKLPVVGGGPGRERNERTEARGEEKRPRTGSRYAQDTGGSDRRGYNQGAGGPEDPDRRKRIAIIATVSSICCIMVCVVIAFLFRSVGTEAKSTETLKKEAQNFMEYYTDSLPSGSTMSVSDVQISSDGAAIRMNCTVDSINGGQQQLVYGYKSEAGIWNYIDDDSDTSRPGKIVEEPDLVQGQVVAKVEEEATLFEPGAEDPGTLEAITETPAADGESGDLQPELPEEQPGEAPEDITVTPGTEGAEPVIPATEGAAEPPAPEVPATEALEPSTEAPTTEAAAQTPEEPSTEAAEPSTEAPATEAPEPSTEAPAIEVPEPSTEAPSTEVPEPSTEVPSTEAPEPSTEAPSTEAPEPSTEAPSTEAPEPSTEAPTTEAPEPSTEAPATEVPEPSTEAPVTEPSTEENEPEIGLEAEGYWECTGIYDYQQAVWLDEYNGAPVAQALQLELDAEGNAVYRAGSILAEGFWEENADGVYLKLAEAEEQLYYYQEQLYAERDGMAFYLERKDGAIDRTPTEESEAQTESGTEALPGETEWEMTEAWTDIWVESEAGQEEIPETEALTEATAGETIEPVDEPMTETEVVETEIWTEAAAAEDMPESWTEAAETEAPETEAAETEAPETEAAETEAPETEAVETEALEPIAPETELTVEAPETEAPVDSAELLNTYLSSTVAPQKGYMGSDETAYTYGGNTNAELGAYQGICSSLITDLDGDGSQEMLVNSYGINPDTGTMGILTTLYYVQDGVVAEGGTFAKSAYAGSGNYRSEQYRIFVKGNYVCMYESGDSSMNIQIYSYSNGTMSRVNGASFTADAYPADLMNWLYGSGLPAYISEIGSDVTMMTSMDARTEGEGETAAGSGVFKNN